MAYTAEPNNLDNESPAALITELLRSRVCNPLARSAGVFKQFSHVEQFRKNIPALRARGLHMVELDTRACCALVIKKKCFNG